jgi:hypothetical protein
MLNFNVPRVQAKMLGTDDVLLEQQNADHKAEVAKFMARDDVKEIMTQHGVDPAEAQKRVDSLSNDELAKLANSIDQLPAGGSAVGVIVGAALLIFLVLLITDILGLTNVFPFVVHKR